MRDVFYLIQVYMVCVINKVHFSVSATESSGQMTTRRRSPRLGELAHKGRRTTTRRLVEPVPFWRVAGQQLIHTITMLDHSDTEVGKMLETVFYRVQD